MGVVCITSNLQCCQESNVGDRIFRVKEMRFHPRYDLLGALGHVSRNDVVITKGVAGKTKCPVNKSGKIVIFIDCMTGKVTSLNFSFCALYSRPNSRKFDCADFCSEEEGSEWVLVELFEDRADLL